MPKCGPKSFMQITFLQIPGPPGEISGLEKRKVTDAGRTDHPKLLETFRGKVLSKTSSFFTDREGRQAGRARDNSKP